MRSTVLQMRGYKGHLLLGGKILSLRCGRGQYNKRGHGADSGQKLLLQCGQRTQIFCPRHL